MLKNNKSSVGKRQKNKSSKRRRQKRQQFTSKVGTVIAPTITGTTLRTSFLFTGSGVRFTQPANVVFYNTSHLVLPIHPLMLGGRCFSIAQNFTTFQINSCRILYSPLVGTGTGGSLEIASVEKCSPVENNEANLFTRLGNMSGQISPIWSPTTYDVPIVKKMYYPMIPTDKNDIPYTVYACLSDAASTLSTMGAFYVEVNFSFTGNISNTEVRDTITTGSFTLGAGGVQGSFAGLYGLSFLAVSSTVPSIDLGEFVQIPALPLATTDYNVPVLHNGTAVNYGSTEDRGVLSGSYLRYN